MAPAPKSPAPRAWRIEAGRDENGDLTLDRDQVIQALLEVENIGHRLGGGFLIEPDRSEVFPGVWETVAWTFVWRSTGPKAQKAPKPDDDGPDTEEIPVPEESQAT